MQKPKTIEYLYLDFDGFFASVMQQAYPRLRGKPVGIVPFDGKNTHVLLPSPKKPKHVVALTLCAMQKRKKNALK